MKNLFLFSLFIFFSCSSDENTDENGFNPNSTLRENLSSITSSTKLYYSVYKESPLTFEVAYFFSNDGYVINYKTVADDWGNNGTNTKCICPEFHKGLDYKLDDMIVIEDSKDRFSWTSVGSTPTTYSLELSNNQIKVSSSRNGVFWTFREITDTQYLDYLDKEATYENCH